MVYKYTVFILILVADFSKCDTLKKNDADSVVLLHVLFRHGERTPDPNVYPNDPYINETYYPYGVGLLRNDGKVTCYNLGKRLRRQYNDFLGEYSPSKVFARSTAFDRTKMSLEALFAGLYPPKGSNKWSKNVNWQPLVYSFVPVPNDDLLRVKKFSCARYVEEYMAALHSPALREIKERNDKIYRFLSPHLGICVTKPVDLLYIYFHLKIQDDMGLRLPSWTKGLYPDFFLKSVMDEELLSTATPKMIRLSIGRLIRKIVNDTYALINGDPAVRERKIYLYSAHGNEVSFTLMALKVFNPNISYPPDGANIVYEVNKTGRTYWFRIYYQHNKFDKPQVLNIPGCGRKCPLETFVHLFKDHIATDADTC